MLGARSDLGSAFGKPDQIFESKKAARGNAVKPLQQYITRTPDLTMSFSISTYLDMNGPNDHKWAYGTRAKVSKCICICNALRNN